MPHRRASTRVVLWIALILGVPLILFGFTNAASRFFQFLIHGSALPDFKLLVIQLLGLGWIVVPLWVGFHYRHDALISAEGFRWRRHYSLIFAAISIAASLLICIVLLLLEINRTALAG